MFWRLFPFQTYRFIPFLFIYSTVVPQFSSHFLIDGYLWGFRGKYRSVKTFKSSHSETCCIYPSIKHLFNFFIRIFYMLHHPLATWPPWQVTCRRKGCVEIQAHLLRHKKTGALFLMTSPCPGSPYWNGKIGNRSIHQKTHLSYTSNFPLGKYLIKLQFKFLSGCFFQDLPISFYHVGSQCREGLFLAVQSFH